MSNRLPFCVKQNVVGSHSQSIPINLGAVVHTGCGVPAAKLKGAGLKSRGIIGNKVVLRKICAVGQTVLSFVADDNTVVVELKVVVNDSAVVEVNRAATGNVYLTVAERGVRAYLIVAVNVKEVLCLGDVVVICLYLGVKNEMLAAVLHVVRLAIQHLKVVAHCLGVVAAFVKRQSKVLAGHICNIYQNLRVGVRV